MHSLTTTVKKSPFISVIFCSIVKQDTFLHMRVVSGKRNFEDLPFCLTERHFLSKCSDGTDKAQLAKRKCVRIVCETTSNMNAKNAMSVCVLMIVSSLITPKPFFTKYLNNFNFINM